MSEKNTIPSASGGADDATKSSIPTDLEARLRGTNANARNTSPRDRRSGLIRNCRIVGRCALPDGHDGPHQSLPTVLVRFERAILILSDRILALEARVMELESDPAKGEVS
jgi:hypothetical protein